MNPRLRWLGALAAVAVLVAAAWLARAPMRITLVNTTLRIDDPWTRAAAFALAGCGLVALAAALPEPRLRIQRTASSSSLFHGTSRVEYSLNNLP